MILKRYKDFIIKESKNEDENTLVYLYYNVYTNRRGKYINDADKVRKKMKISTKDSTIDIVEFSNKNYNGEQIKQSVLIVSEEVLKSKGFSEDYKSPMGDKGLWNSLNNTIYAPNNIYIGTEKPNYSNDKGWEMVKANKPLFIIDGVEITPNLSDNVNENLSLSINKYTQTIQKYEKIIKSKNIEKIDGIYDCHEWVSIIPEEKNIKIYLFDEEKEKLYYKKANGIDIQFEEILDRNGFPQYFEYSLGHSFIKVNDIFIDLTLDSMGLTYEEIQLVCKELSKLDIFHVNENINEAVLPKDLDRMKSILKKSNGDQEKIFNYAKAMANAIKDKHKAFQRGKAADEIIKDKEVANLFYDKAKELGLDFDVNVERSQTGMNKFGITVPKLGSKMSNVHEEPQKKQWEPYSILPIGSVNIQTGESKHFNVYTIWPDSTAEVWKDEKDNYRLIFTSGLKPLNNIGWIGSFRNYQTWNEIGYGWEMVEWVNVKNLKELLRIYGKTSMKGYTYK